LYQFSHLDIASRQNLYSIAFNREITNLLSYSLGTQYTNVSNQVEGLVYDAGGTFNFSGFTIIQPQFSYYKNKDLSTAGNKSSAYSYSTLLRQALNKVTALQTKYTYFHSKGAVSSFHSNTLTTWLSRYFYTETALHISFRYHWNSELVKTYSTELETIQYIKGTSLLRFIYRYYTSKPGNSLPQLSVQSHSAAIVLDYYLFSNTILSLKYRLYMSNQHITMNTYLIGFERLF
jgi:hypothetical protein